MTPMHAVRKITRFFDKLEDHVRGALSHYPIAYTFVGGVGIVLFWRGVWHLADWLSDLVGMSYQESAILSIVVSVTMLLMIGLFVSFFVSDRIILTGIKREKKLVEKTAAEVKEEETKLLSINDRLDKIEQVLAKIAAKFEP